MSTVDSRRTIGTPGRAACAVAVSWSAGSSWRQPYGPLPRRSNGLSSRHDGGVAGCAARDRKSTRLNSSHVSISYAVFCLKKKKNAILHEMLYLRVILLHTVKF